MSRKKTNTLDLKGKSINDLLNMNTSTLSESDLRKYASKLVSASNKRIKRLAESKYGEVTPDKRIHDYVEAKEGDKAKYLFTIRGASTTDVSNTIKQMRAFLKNRTANLKDYKIIRAEIEERIGGKFKTIQQEKDFWKAYRQQIKKSQINKKSFYDSTTALKDMYTAVKEGKTLRQAKNVLKKKAKQKYEEGESKILLEENEDGLVISGDALVGTTGF